MKKLWRWKKFYIQEIKMLKGFSTSSQYGFSIFESVAALLISSIISFLCFNFFSVSNSSFLKVQRKLEKSLIQLMADSNIRKKVDAVIIPPWNTTINSTIKSNLISLNLSESEDIDIELPDDVMFCDFLYEKQNSGVYLLSFIYEIYGEKYETKISKK